MIVALRTVAQAATVAAATGCVQVRVSKKDPVTGGQVLVPSRFVDLGDIDLSGFETYRAAVEAVTVMFELRSSIDKDAVVYDNGWVFTAAKFEVVPTDPGTQWGKIASHFGARRMAYNWVVGAVKANLDARQHTPDTGDQVALLRWDFQTLRNHWNRVKDEVAPWWAENSKEAYASGVADAATALKNWSDSKRGTRKGKKVGFPGFKSRRTDSARVRFTTGAMRFEADRRTIVLPVIGAMKSKENTRRVQRHLASGRARLLSLTLTGRWGRLFISASYAVRKPTTPLTPAKPDVTAGVDLGLRHLATVTDTNGETHVFANPKPLRATMNQRRRLGRAQSRRIPGSRAHTAAKAKMSTLDRRAVHLRAQAMHQLTTWLTRTYGTVVAEDLDLAAMKRSMGRRAFRRSVSDAALGQFRPMLTYKAAATGTVVILADRWFPSSQIHHGCGCRLLAQNKLDQWLTCTTTGELIDRDINASTNLRDWPKDHQANLSPVGTQDPSVSTSQGGDAGPEQANPVPGEAA